MKNQNISPEDHRTLIELLDQALNYRDALSEDRRDAQALYDGDVGKWLEAKPKRSTVVSDDVQATIGKVLPGLVRTILGNEIVADYGAQNQDDEPGAQQATEFINLVLLDECKARKAIYSAMHDACKIRNGILYVGADEKVEVRGSEHTDINDQQLMAIVQEEGVEILEHEAKQGPVDELTGQPTQLHDIKIKRVTRKKTPRMDAVPMEEYLIHPDATNSHEDAAIVGREYLTKRSDLMARWPDRAEEIAALPEAVLQTTQEGEKMQRRKSAFMGTITGSRELHLIQVYDLYVRLDMDGDGISELRHIVMCGQKDTASVFENEYADFVPYYDVVIEELPHQWEGVSIADHVGDIMLAKTALLRGFQDNVYMVNDPQAVVNSDRLLNDDALLNREPGRPLFVRGTDNVNNAVSYNMVPFIGDKAMMGIGYWDKQIVDRSGIDDSSAGLPPDALQNVTAKASAMLEQKGIAKTELITRTVAECLKGPFSGLLKLVIQHCDKPRMVRLRGKYVEVDPKSWNADMDVNINTGLGAGSRERDMMVMQGILATQERVYTQIGESPILGLENISNTLRKSVHAAGITNADQFFPMADKQALDQYQQQKAQQKPMEIQVIEAKTQADVALRQAEIPLETELERIKVEAATQKEIAQGEAAVQEAVAKAEIEAGVKKEELRIKEKEVDNKLIIEREKMAHDAKIAAQTNEADIQKEKAKSFGAAVTQQDEEANAPAKNAGPKLVELIQSMQKPKKRKLIYNDKGDVEGIEDVPDTETKTEEAA